MPHGGTLIIDGRGHVAIEFVINSMTEATGHTIYAGKFWASPNVLALAKKATHLEIDGQVVVITGSDNESISFKPI